MWKTILLTAALSSAATLVTLLGAAHALPSRILLENARVRVTETTYSPGVPRERSLREHDQVIVFLDACKYERKDSETGQKTARAHASGDVIWHGRGEDAPRLTNLGATAYRTLVIEIK